MFGSGPRAVGGARASALPAGINVEVVIRSLTAQAWLATPGSELAGARERAAAGDADWALWVEEFDRAEATLIDMRVSIAIELDDSLKTVAMENHQVWMRLAEHPPIIAALIAELAGKDFDILASRIRELGGHISVHELRDMYVRVDLGDDLVDALGASSEQHARRSQPAARPGLETEQG
jgi:hypothetical protein